MISLSIGSLLLALGINLQTSKKRTVVLVRNELIALLNKIFCTRACPPCFSQMLDGFRADYASRADPKDVPTFTRFAR